MNFGSFFLPQTDDVLIEWDELLEHTLALAPRHAVWVIDILFKNVAWKENQALWPLIAKIVALNHRTGPREASRTKQDFDGCVAISDFASNLIPFFIDTFTYNQESNTRKIIARFLKDATEDEDVRKMYYKAFGDPDSGIQSLAHSALKRAVKYVDVRDYLLKALLDKDISIRFTAMVALEEASEYEDVRQTLLQYKRDHEPEVKLAVNWILRRATRIGEEGEDSSENQQLDSISRLAMAIKVFGFVNELTGTGRGSGNALMSLYKGKDINGYAILMLQPDC